MYLLLLIFIPRHTIVVVYYGLALAVCVSVHLSYVRLSAYTNGYVAADYGQIQCIWLDLFH